MKRILLNIIAICLSVLGLMSCSDYLNKTDYDIITPEQVWKEPKLIKAVLVNLYSNVQTESFDYWYNAEWRLQNPTTLSDEAQGSFQKDPMFDNGNATYTYQDALFEQTFSNVYKYIRNCNDFIAQVQQAPSLDDATKSQLIGEARFIRAMHYFTLVKRYGGVPLIKESQEYDAGNLESLQVARDQEADVYQFIVDEANAAADALPAKRVDTEKYQANKYAALSLASRAALYAATIAKYGKVQLDGIVGIDSGLADKFFMESYEASKQIIDSNVYALYNKMPENKMQNYCNMFLKGNGDNGEYIFQIQYNVAAGKGHSWDKRNAPFSYRGGGWGCGIAVTLEMVESYENIDGTEGTLKITNDDGVPIRLTDPIDLFVNKDPRLLASVYVPGSPCQNTKIEWRRGVIDLDGTRYQADNQPNQATSVTCLDGKTYARSGKDGGADAGDASKTGFYQKKFFDETLTDMNMGKSETPWPVFRLGEIYLNLAEAAFELGKTSEALDATNKIRVRAGIKTLSSISLEKIRHERKVELAFEGHRYWDLKRWRLAHLDVRDGGLNGFKGSALYPWYNVSDGKYTFEKNANTPKQTRIFLEKNYYTKINSNDMNSNPKLVQNPGFTN
jgi:hypothetical protein